MALEKVEIVDRIEVLENGCVQDGLTQQELKNEFDYKDGKLYWKLPRVGRAVGSIAGSQKPDGRRRIGFKRKDYLAHRLIFMWHHGYLPESIDHINGDHSDNRIENLREAAHWQNMANSKLHSNNTTGVKGVYKHKKNQNWCVRVYRQNQLVYRKSFDNLALAELVAVEAREKYHGSFARHY